MTGLDVHQDKLLEIFIQVTNNELECYGHLHIVLACPEDILNGMGDWCKEHHSRREQKNGLLSSSLLDDVTSSTVTLAEAEIKMLQFINNYEPHDSVMMAGASVFNDRAFLVHHMPALAKRLHYRVLDVSSIKEATSRFQVRVKTPKFRSTHRARSDVMAVIELMRCYKTALFWNDPNYEPTWTQPMSHGHDNGHDNGHGNKTPIPSSDNHQ